MVRSHRCAKSYVCAVLVTVIVFFNILTVHQLSKSRPSHFIHTYGSLYVGRLNKFKTCRPIGLSSKPLPLISLASYPGSGNTWLRHLLQQATGMSSLKKNSVTLVDNTSVYSWYILHDNLTEWTVLRFAL